MATLRQLTFTHKLAKDDRPRNKRDLRTISTVYRRQNPRPRSARNPVILKILLILSKNTSARHGFADLQWQSAPSQKMWVKVRSMTAGPTLAEAAVPATSRTTR